MQATSQPLSHQSSGIQFQLTLHEQDDPQDQQLFADSDVSELQRINHVSRPQQGHPHLLEGTILQQIQSAHSLPQLHAALLHLQPPQLDGCECRWARSACRPAFVPACMVRACACRRAARCIAITPCAYKQNTHSQFYCTMQGCNGTAPAAVHAYRRTAAGSSITAAVRCSRRVAAASRQHTELGCRGSCAVSSAGTGPARTSIANHASHYVSRVGVGIDHCTVHSCNAHVDLC